jgi:hypothetical protein
VGRKVLKYYGYGDPFITVNLPSVSYTFLLRKVANLPQRHRERRVEKNGLYQLVPLWIMCKTYIAE